MPTSINIKASLLKHLKSILDTKIINTLVWYIKHRNMDSSYLKNIKGKNNIINISDLSLLTDCVFDIEGEGNEIVINEFCDIKLAKFFVRGNNNKIHIGIKVSVIRDGEFWVENNNCLIEVGAQTTFENIHLAATENSSQIIIGKDCMFAYGIDVRTGDSHSIIDLETNNRINYAKNVVIGEHVWVAAHCSILKGVIISNDTIVATRSVVTKQFTTPGIIVGGNPAKVIKENVTWDRARI